MSSYIPPSASGIVFDFTASGYDAPVASGILFAFDLRPIYSSYSDLSASIDSLAISGSADLSAFARPTTPSSYDLASFLQTIPPADLLAFVRPTHPTYANLNAAIRRIDKEQPFDLGGSIQSFTTSDLSAFIGAHPPADLGGAITSWYRENIKNLGALATGEFFKGQSDLISLIGTHLPANLAAFLQCWSIKDLSAHISSIYKADLPAFIQSTSLKNLGAIIQCISPVNLRGLIHGWDERFLPAEIVGIYGPYDLQAYLRVHPYLNLPAAIHGWYSGIKDLRGIIEGYYIFDLGAMISAIQAANLGAILTAVGKTADLLATIIPNVIRLRRAIQICLLDYRDLKAVINVQCRSSAFADLGVTFGIIYKKLDLTAFVWGWKNLDGYKNLAAYINTAICSTEDKLPIRFVPNIRPYSKLRVRFGVTDKYTAFDVLPIFYGQFFTKNLSATIYASPRFTDLSASIEPVLQTNYTELPDYINPKSHEVVIKFNEKWQEQWRRFVEIMFKKDGPAPYHYFYVSGTNKVYKIDRTRNWTIWATSYEKSEDGMIERENIRTKFIFKMSKYNKVDEAVRDLIDRVSAYRESDLSATISGISPWTAEDLGAAIYPYGYPKHTWAKSLGASITAQFPEYVPPSGDAADLTISGSYTYTPPVYDEADLIIAYEGYPGT
jgi:hypothetical protein